MHIPTRRRAGVSLIEMLVVLAIIAGMIALLFPALHAARESSRQTVCRNNIHQLSLALRNNIELSEQFPKEGRWPIVLLPWMEEQPLATALRDGRESAALHRPVLFRCPSQADITLEESEVRTCWYYLVVDRGNRRRGRSIRRSWSIRDRQRNLKPKSLLPWYVGPEIHPAVYHRLEEAEVGPHNGQFN